MINKHGGCVQDFECQDTKTLRHWGTKKKKAAKVPGIRKKDFFWFGVLVIQRLPASFLFFMLVLICHVSPSFANNLLITNVSLEDRDAVANTAVVEFDISWGNSWRVDGAPYNYDAVWVFLKVCKGESCSPYANTAWAHGMLKTAGRNPSGTSSGSNADLVVDVQADRVGAFLYRQSAGSGTMSSSNVRLVMDYSESPLSAGDTDNIQVKVFGVEMVYIPEGSFYAGDTSSTAGFMRGSADTDPWPVTSEEAISVTNAASGGYYYTSGGNLGESTSGSVFTIPGGFPKGYGAFYLMKYELSQGQYRDFLNTLTQAQQNTRTAAVLTNEDDANTYVMVAEDQGTVEDRQTIKAGANPADGYPYMVGCDLNDNDVLNESGDGEWIAMNYISWMDMVAYADWAGLRPMTELEFEKAARGVLDVVAGEYAWGTTGTTQARSPIVNAGQANEIASTTGNGLANYDGDGGMANPRGPLRVGFSAESSTDRVSSGSGYYGHMNLSDNLKERTVTVGNSTGLAFGGSHGDGVLTTTSSYEGNATSTDWPGIDGTSARGVTGATGSGFRGGDWESTSALETVSGRVYAAQTVTSRQSDSGGRLARTADPKVTVVYVSAAATTGDLTGRSGVDAFCAANKPGNLSVTCVNHRGFVSVSASDEIRDMPLNYGYQSYLPIYWWHNTNKTYQMMATNWADALDSSILASQQTGTGVGSTVWTGSTSAGALAATHCVGWTSASSGQSGRYGSHSSTSGTYLDSGSASLCDASVYLRCACQIDVNNMSGVVSNSGGEAAEK